MKPIKKKIIFVCNIIVVNILLLLMPNASAYNSDFYSSITQDDFCTPLTPTSRFTIDGELIYEVEVQIESEIQIPIYCTENIEFVESFIEYDIAGNSHERYKTIDTPMPIYTVYVCGGTEYKIPVAEDISGTKIIIPECDFSLPPQYASREDADDYKFTCWRDDEYKYFYFPGTTFLIPDRNITLYAVWTKGDVVNSNIQDDKVKNEKTKSTDTEFVKNNENKISIKGNDIVIGISCAALVLVTGIIILFFRKR